MSNDLISRSAVIAIIKKKRLMVGKHDLSAEYKLLGVQEEIENLPIAYDVDKVVEQLEEDTKYFQSEADGLAQVGNWGTATELQGKASAYKDAVKIVKSGGIE